MNRKLKSILFFGFIFLLGLFHTKPAYAADSYLQMFIGNQSCGLEANEISFLVSATGKTNNIKVENIRYDLEIILTTQANTTHTIAFLTNTIAGPICGDTAHCPTNQQTVTHTASAVHGGGEITATISNVIYDLDGVPGPNPIRTDLTYVDVPIASTCTTPNPSAPNCDASTINQADPFCGPTDVNCGIGFYCGVLPTVPPQIRCIRDQDIDNNGFTDVCNEPAGGSDCTVPSFCTDNNDGACCGQSNCTSDEMCIGSGPGTDGVCTTQLLCAQNLGTGGGSVSPYDGPEKPLDEIISIIYRVLFYGGLAISFLYFASGLYEVMTSEGDPRKKQYAVGKLMRTFWGTLFTIFSLVILRLVLESFITPGAL